ncbi:hypothetical protein A1O3_06171 [Capronia epimyces CBS 606.96]|uniref:AAA+ ATPase domain-containing protein n=1 Tax=Capronia epimyces CBS 606.96 TaxID=1182542 RepID=W9XQ93_9EURO|nr:uncharacterized protein A1O3_06171 [Capronia epimyces CBS 606.96]EXJ82358.1 hypothetical protein A1O3_06171 [Capronia epimyces CBS 606.96]
MVEDMAQASHLQIQASLEKKIVALEAKVAAYEWALSKLQPEPVVAQAQESASDDGEAEAQEPADDTAGPPPTREADAGPKSRAKILVSVIDLRTRERKQIRAEEQPNEGGTADTPYAHYPFHIFRGAPTTLYSPYEALVLNWEKLEEAVKVTTATDNATDKQARSDLKLLLDTISSSSGDARIDKYFKIRDSCKSQQSVTFENLWTIFPPGTLVYGRPFQDQDQLFVVLDSVRQWPYFSDEVPREQASWTLLAWTYDWDGKKFRRNCLQLEFDYFEGSKPITSLPYFPFDLHDRRHAITTALLKRGEKYRALCTATQGSRLFDYRGNAVLEKQGFSGLQGDDQAADESQIRRAFWEGMMDALKSKVKHIEQRGAPPKSSVVDSRVMVDFESYFVFGPAVARVGSLWPDDEQTQCNCNDCRENVLLNDAYRTRFDELDRQEGTWEDEQYLLCPPRVLGYALQDKQWAQLEVGLLENIPEKDPEDAWSTRLKLADGGKTKKMILELVEGHGKAGSSEIDRLEVDDIIAKKGKGLVNLLYGPPGVGKTSTAETVALAARKPLFAISVADVGTRAKNVEANLNKIFDLATSWQAILLIDEADVFLESRGQGVASNTERNALVSVFLRVLEYYQGILMLTTNQIAKFDVAVQSRIHVAFKYISLNEEQTMAIFEGFLGPLAKKGLVKNWEDVKEWLEEDVVKMGFDGRQIRNIVTSALGLARAQRKSRLDKSDLKLVMNNVKDFKDEFIKQFEKYKTEQAGGRDALM